MSTMDPEFDKLAKTLSQMPDQLPPGGTVLPDEYLAPGPVPAQPSIEQRVYAACRWAAALAVKELVDGAELTMHLRDAGPQRFLPGESEWERINETAKMGINYVVHGTTTAPQEDTDGR